MSLEELNARIVALEQRVGKLEGHLEAGGSALTRPKKMSAKEFLLTVEANSEVQKVLAIAYFLEFVEGVPSFNITDLISAFRAAKERPPKNMNDAVNKNIARGFLMDAEERKDSLKAWCLTATGERQIKAAGR
jgi:hypothetical protein